MRKPVWVRIMGWLGVAALIFGFMAMYTRPKVGATPESDLLTMLIGSAGVLLLIVWTLVSMLLWAIRKNAGAQAAAAVQSAHTAAGYAAGRAAGSSDRDRLRAVPEFARGAAL